MNKKVFIFAASALIFLIAIVVGLTLKNSRPPSSGGQVSGASTTNDFKNVNVKEFTVVGTNYAFSPNTITVNKGDNVRIIFKDEDGVHNLVINGYDLATNVINSGQETIEFVADKTGQFEFYCSVGSHRDLGMVGTLIVQ